MQEHVPKSWWKGKWREGRREKEKEGRERKEGRESLVIYGEMHAIR